VGGPCYLFDDQRLVLPAYSTETVGVNVRHDPRWAAFRCAVIAGDQVLDFGKLSDLPGSRRS
jgi:metallophosphoesterase superfamily enzyme